MKAYYSFDMPENCWKCPFENETHGCMAGAHIDVHKDTRPDDCPLEEERHGKCKISINGYNIHYECLECGTEMSGEIMNMPEEFNYCPNCGARMDGV